MTARRVPISVPLIFSTNESPMRSGGGQLVVSRWTPLSGFGNRTWSRAVQYFGLI